MASHRWCSSTRPAGNPTTQCLAYSTDGRTFTKYAGNPVLKQITGGNRDPKVIWHEPTKQWVMVLYVELAGKHTIHFYTSPNLKEWTLAQQVTDGFFRVPGFLRAAGGRRCVAERSGCCSARAASIASACSTGKSSSRNRPRCPGHRGKGFYAAQSFSDVPDGRRLFIGWFQTETKGMPFNQSMTVPLELRLTQTDDGPRHDVHAGQGAGNAACQDPPVRTDDA